MDVTNVSVTCTPSPVSNNFTKANSFDCLDSVFTYIVLRTKYTYINYVFIYSLACDVTSRTHKIETVQKCTVGRLSVNLRVHSPTSYMCTCPLTIKVLFIFI